LSISALSQISGQSHVHKSMADLQKIRGHLKALRNDLYKNNLELYADHIDYMIDEMFSKEDMIENELFLNYVSNMRPPRLGEIKGVEHGSKEKSWASDEIRS